MQADRIGKYRIIAKLGQGGMATVFLSIAAGPVGFNKLLGARRQLWATRTLGERGEIPKLIAWYGR